MSNSESDYLCEVLRDPIQTSRFTFFFSISSRFSVTYNKLEASQLVSFGRVCRLFPHIKCAAKNGIKQISPFLNLVKGRLQ